MTNTTTTAKFHTLQSAYIEKLTGRFRQIEEESHQVIYSTEASQEHILSLYSSLHKLVGSAGIYGIVNVANAAAVFLDWMRPFRENSLSLTREHHESVEHHLMQLGKEVHAAVSTHSKSDVHPMMGVSPVRMIPPVKMMATQRAAKGAIYIVDDEEDQSVALEFYLKQAGYEVAIFKSPAEIEKALEYDRPGAIIMDMMFPEGDLAGADVVKRICATNKELPVLFLSARNDIMARLAATRAGGMHYFSKPVDMSRIISKLNKVTKTSRTARKKVLFIDDDKESLEYIALRFVEEGFDVETLNEPLNVFDRLTSFRPDLLVLDINMPECNGMELAKVIRQHERYTDMPIIFLTSETDLSVRLHALELGGDDFFNKQMDSSLLIKAVKSRLKRLQEFAVVKEASMWSP